MAEETTIKKTNSKVTLIDVEGCVLGRAASLISKRLLNGEAIDVINAEKALVSEHSAEDYLIASKRGGRDWGPYMPKNAVLWFRRTIRGMVPRGIPRGTLAMRRFRAYEGVPTKYSGKPAEKLSAMKPAQTVHKYLTLKEFSINKMGARVK
jgi:large subunit ribosomal protein L13